MSKKQRCRLCKSRNREAVIAGLCRKCAPRCIAIVGYPNKRCSKPAHPRDSLCARHYQEKRKMIKSSKKQTRSHRSPKSGYVYIVYLGAGNLYKIGMTSNLDKRLSALESSNPWLEKELVYFVNDKSYVESELHHRFKHKRAQREIFELNENDLIEAKRILESYGKQQ